MHAKHSASPPAILNCELCIVGAGIAGLNALHSATCYLKPTDRVVLVDARSSPGGMWQDTYDFVRLHQPHRMFTVGDIAWKRRLPAAHLADKGQVNAQFEHCLERLGQRVALKRLFAHRYLSHREEVDSGGGRVLVQVQPCSGEPPCLIRTDRLIKAVGLDIAPTQGLALSSRAVHSVSPHQLDNAENELALSNAPIVIVGGGKTAMDTAHELIRRHPRRAIDMIIGDGVMFADRDKLFTRGWRRWWGGVAFFEMFLDMALRFNGGNVEEVNRYRQARYCLALNDHPRQYQVGVLSGRERATIRDGLRRYVEDYLEDVVDTATGPQLRLRSGRTLSVPRGAWFVNCTGYIGREQKPYEPYVSESGRVLSINLTSAVFFLSSFSAYFLTHLMFRDLLRTVPLYPVNVPKLSATHKHALGTVAEASTVLNILLLMKALPISVFARCRLDMNRWYPLPRRIPVLMKYLWNGDRYAEHCRNALERFEDESRVGCGVLQRPHNGTTRAKRSRGNDPVKRSY